MATAKETDHFPLDFRYSERFTSGMLQENRNIEWKLEKLAILCSDKDLIQDQQLQIELGESIGKKCVFRFNLEVEEVEDKDSIDKLTAEKKSWIGFYTKMLSGAVNKTWLNFTVQAKGKTRETSIYRQLGITKYIAGKSCWGWEKFIPLKANKFTLPLVYDALILQTDLDLMVNESNAISSNPKEQTIVEKGLRNFSSSVLKLLTEFYDDMSLSDITLTSKDGKRFKLHRAILAVRSPVFLAMLRSKMKESVEGEIQVDDLSGDTLKVLVEYIYSGLVPAAWCKPEIITEFTYAAGKYQLTELLEFLDNNLSIYCTEKTVVKLLGLANKLSLKNAESGLKQVVKMMMVKTNETEDLLSLLRDPEEQ